MKESNILRNVLTMLFLSITMSVSAQLSRGDKLFLEGQTLQQTMTIASQNAAIKKFQQAKVAFTTIDKKSQCDNQITICKKTIDRLKTSTSSVSKQPTASAQNIELSISPDTVVFDGTQQGSATIAVSASHKDWKFNSDNTISEQTFAQVDRNDDTESIKVQVSKNPTTLERQQAVAISLKDVTKTLTIIQRGKPVTLSTNENLLKFKTKGGEKKIEIYTNSDSIYEDTNDLTWIVESKPDWIETHVEVAKEKGFFGKAISAGKTVIKGKAAAATETDAKTSTLTIIALPIAKNSPEYQGGRRGEIVFASQYKRYKIVVLQQ